MVGIAANIVGNDFMKRFLSILLSFVLMLLLAGCQGNTNNPNFRDESAYDERDGFAESLKSDYLSFRKIYPEQKNNVCYYVNAQNKMPEGREVKVCFTNPFSSGWREAGTVNISSMGVDVSDEQYIFTFGKHFPVNTVTAMTGYQSVDDLFDKIGQVQTYEEFGDFCAFSVNQYDRRPEYVDTVFWGTANDVKSVDISFGKLSQPPDQSLQITEENIYYFAYDYGVLTKSSITVVRIPKDGGKVITKKIFLSDIGFPDLHNKSFSENIFVDGNNLFMLGNFILSVEPLELEFYIVAYNLETDEFDVYKTQDFKGMGKLFRSDDGLGVMTALFDEQGYYSNMGVRFLNLDENNYKLTFDKDISFAQSENWAYDMGLSEKEFYCIDDMLCGILTYKANCAMMMYVEIDLKTGAVTTCVPFAKNDKKETKGWVFDSILIRDNGRAVSQHNCS